MNESDLVNAKIAYFGRGRDTVSVTESILKDYRGSKQIKTMYEAERYLQAEEDDDIISSSFLNKIVTQKTNFLFGKSFSIDAPEPFASFWNRFLDFNVRKIINSLAFDAVNKGIGWVYVYIDNDNELKLSLTAPETVYPAWHDNFNDDLDAVVLDYTEIEYINSQKRAVKKVEFWNQNGVYRFADNSATGIKLETEAVTSHMQYLNAPYNWDMVPFIPLKGNRMQKPVLTYIKAFIDAYDELNTKSVKALLNDIDPFIVVKNLSPDIDSLAEARRLLTNLRMASVSDDGGLELVKGNTDITSVQMKLEALRKDIFEFSSAVDLHEIKFGSNLSGVAIKAMFQDMDIYANGLELEFKSFIQKLKWFFDRWLLFTEKVKPGQLDYNLDVILNRDLFIDETEIIDNVIKSIGIISEKTVVGNHPWVKDVNEEISLKERSKT